MDLLQEIPKPWLPLLNSIDLDKHFSSLEKTLEQTYKLHEIYPPKSLIFNALSYFPPEKTKVVILGQDPYHGPGQAHGLAFSVPDGAEIPPSLRNIFKELKTDCNKTDFFNGNLTGWAEQGVLLLNATLTVQANLAGSHQGIGWEEITDHIVQSLSASQSHLVIMLWGAAAQKKFELIDDTKHLVLTAPHPSPLSAHRGFFGCRHFSKCNAYLKNHNKTAIDW